MLNDMDTKNLSIARQQFAQCVFTHKVQESAVEKNNVYFIWVKIINIILVSPTLIFLVLQAFNQKNLAYSYIATGITIIEIIFLIVQLNFNFDKKMSKHKDSALKYMALRDRYKNFIVDIVNSNLSDREIRDKRDVLQSEYQIISDTAPETNSEDYGKAQEKLFGKKKNGEEFTWSEDEIDHFLPDTLKLINLKEG